MATSIVIPNYNGIELLDKNLPSVQKAYKNKANNITEVIIVDDGSDDDSVAFVRSRFSDFRVLDLYRNYGFCHAVNAGVAQSNGDLVCLLNSDVVPSVNFLESTADSFRDRSVFGVSLHEAGEGPANLRFVDGYFSFMRGAETTKLSPTFWVSGGSCVVRKRIWEVLGGFDERLFSPFYWEDLDISYRAAKRGYKLLWDPQANVVHKHESTISKLPRQYVNRIRERNELLFLWKNLSSEKLLRQHFIGLGKRLSKHPGYAKVLLMAATRVYKVISRRVNEKRFSTVTDEEILGIS